MSLLPLGYIPVNGCLPISVCTLIINNVSYCPLGNNMRVNPASPLPCSHLLQLPHKTLSFSALTMSFSRVWLSGWYFLCITVYRSFQTRFPLEDWSSDVCSSDRWLRTRSSPAEDPNLVSSTHNPNYPRDLTPSSGLFKYLYSDVHT